MSTVGHDGAPQVGGAWPALLVDSWTETRETLHMWLQIVGKLRLAGAPMVDHWWQATSYVTPRGLTTGSIPDRTRTYSIDLDFHDHELRIESDDGARAVRLERKSVASFYAEVLTAVGELGIRATINPSPNEVDPAIPFAEDEQHASYDADAVHLFWRQLVQVDRDRPVEGARPT